MKSWRKYIALATISAKSSLAYFGEVMAVVIFLTVVLFILLKLWQAAYLYQGQKLLGGLGLVQMMMYLMITEACTMSATRIADLVDEDVRTGIITAQLVRPIYYTLAQLSRNLGERGVRFATNLVLGSLVIFMLIGKLQLNPSAFLMLLIVMPLAFTIDFLGNFMIGLTAFWIENSSGFALLYSRLSWILGGMLLPMDLFPSWCHDLLYILPFSQVLYGPARLFVDPSWGQLVSLVIRQLISILFMSFLMWIVYRRAMRQVFSNGG
ncbi:MAG: ABC transporter permease [Legionellales bacterium]